MFYDMFFEGKGKGKGKIHIIHIHARAYGGTKEERGREAGTNTINKDTEEIERFTENGGKYYIKE